jgi:hypothetical protein
MINLDIVLLFVSYHGPVRWTNPLLIDRGKTMTAKQLEPCELLKKLIGVIARAHLEIEE